jgi:cell filamentation protein, protein adenylyltransferase
LLINRINDPFPADENRIATRGERGAAVMTLHGVLQKHPYLTAPDAMTKSGLTLPTANAGFTEL